jgi:hypothetical protein
MHRISGNNRLEQKDLFDNFKPFTGNNTVNSFIMQVLNAQPYVTAILNSDREIVFANEALYKLNNSDKIQDVLRENPGVALSCLYISSDGTCSKTEHCRYCNLTNTITKCIETNKVVSSEWRFTSKINGKNVFHDFLVTVSPLHLEGESFIIFSLNDISNEKRRKALERIFFHDIINSAGSLTGILDVMEGTDDTKKVHELLELAKDTSQHLTEDILAQGELLAAENNELKIRNVSVNSWIILNEQIKKISHCIDAKNKTVLLSKESVETVLTTDIALLKRILYNMMKNAVEATPENGTVLIGCDENENSVTFWVRNPGVIPEEAKSHIFHRYFSTKGTNRGLGTYSMRLIGEQYLKGKVHFESGKENGTTFYIKLKK